MRLLTRSEVARLKGVSPAAVTKACKGPLGAAVRGQGRGALIDIDHPAAVEYLGDAHPAPTSEGDSAGGAGKKPTEPRRRRAEKAPSKRTSKAKAKGAPAPPVAEKPKRGRARRAPSATSLASLAPPEEGPGSTDDLEELAQTLRPLVRRFGTETAFAKWLDQLKKIEDIREKRLKNEETVGTLVQRDAVKQFGFAYIDAAQKLLLRDAARTIAMRLYAMAKAGEPMEEAERTARDILGSNLRPLRATFEKALRNA